LLFGIEIEDCARCSGKLKVIAGIEEPQVIAKILAHLEKTAPDQFQAEPALGARARNVVVAAATCLYTMSPDGQFIVGTRPGARRIDFAAALSGHAFSFRGRSATPSWACDSRPDRAADRVPFADEIPVNKILDPTLDYILRGSNGDTAVVDGGDKFWSQPPGQLGRGRLVSEYARERSARQRIRPSRRSRSAIGPVIAARPVSRDSRFPTVRSIV
jgi:hypothetical protein